MKPHPDEKIDVTQIRITQAGCHAAVLGEFRAADRLLSAWADGVKDFAVDFEVKFEDGYAYRGHYAYRRRSRGRPSLSKFVLREFSGRGPASGELPPRPDLYLIEGF
ncbi:MAG TPA: hypothetical protein VGF27_07845 [Pseudoduganella sp.]|jgi:hypothetical protein